MEPSAVPDSGPGHEPYGPLGRTTYVVSIPLVFHSLAACCDSMRMRSTSALGLGKVRWQQRIEKQKLYERNDT